MIETKTIDGVELRPIPNTKDRYSISRDGRVRSHSRRVPTTNGTGKKRTRIIKGRWISTHKTNDGILKATICIDGEQRHVNIAATVAEVWPMTREERSLILFFETCLVDNEGAVNSILMNEEDHKIALRWCQEGFVQFGRIKARDLVQGRSHWVTFSELAWQAAHLERRARAARLEARRIWKRNPPLFRSTRKETRFENQN